MPEKKTRERASKKKSPSSKAGEYVREEIEHVREGKHGVRSTKQAIAIGLSKARKDGVKIPPAPSKKAGGKNTAAKKSTPQRSGKAAVSHKALSEHSRDVARKRGPAKRKAAAKKAARTRAKKVS